MMNGGLTAHFPDDLRDVRDSLNGDGDAYTRLVERHQGRVTDRMWRFTRDRFQHRELVQEVFVQAFLSLPTYRGDAPFEHWIARISTRVGYRFWKKNERERPTYHVPIDELEGLATSEPEALDPASAAETLHNLLGLLPPRDRLVLVLRYVEDRSVEETAGLTGWTQTMVKVQAWRARAKLKKLLQNSGLEVDR